jgi:hypothetical protein
MTSKYENLKYTHQPINNESYSISFQKSTVKLSKPLNFNMIMLREALAKHKGINTIVKKYKRRFQGAWEELSEK